MAKTLCAIQKSECKILSAIGLALKLAKLKKLNDPDKVIHNKVLSGSTQFFFSSLCILNMIYLGQSNFYLQMYILSPAS